MKYIRSLFLMILNLVSLILCSQVNNYSPKPKIYAVIVGVSAYKDADIPTLKYPEKDAVAFYEFLRSVKAGVVQDENIVLLTGPKATRSNILKSVTDIFIRASREDLIIFYFSGHGRAGEFENTGYLLNYDAENDNDAGSALSMAEVKSKIDGSQAKMKISYIDACHAGLFKSTAKGFDDANSTIINAYLEGLSRASTANICFLASSTRQQSIEDDKLGHGVFTYYLLQGLNGAADLEQEGAEGYNNGVVTTGELATYLTNKIQLATKYKQRPTIDGDPDGFFPISVLRSDVSLFSEISKKSVKPPVPIKKEPQETKDKPCDSKGGDFTFINSSTQSIKVTIDFPDDRMLGGGYTKELIIKPGEKGTLYNLKPTAYEFRIWSSTSIALWGSGQFKVEACKEKTYTYR